MSCGQAIGGIKSQQKILRERVDAVERAVMCVNAEWQQIDKLHLRVEILLVSVGAFFATVIIGSFLR